MPKLPYTETQVIDNSAYQSTLVNDTGINIATIVNADTGPLDRVSLRNSSDLVNYFCTGSKVTAKSDPTIQVLDAMLGTTGVDVIRVGNSKLRIGKTNDNKLVYTDSNFNIIDKLTRVKFNVIESEIKTLCLQIDNIVYYVGEYKQSFGNNSVTLPDNEDGSKPAVTIENLIKCVSQNNSCLSFGDDYIITTTDKISCDIGELHTVSIETTYNDYKEIVTSLDETTESISVNSYIIINNIVYFFAGNNTSYSQDMVDALINKHGDVIKIFNYANTIKPALFLAKIISSLNIRGENEFVYSVQFNAENITFSSGSTDKYGMTDTFDFSKRLLNNRLTYNHTDDVSNGYFEIDTIEDDGEILRTRYTWNMGDLTEENFPTEPTDIRTEIHNYTIPGITDFVQILQHIEIEEGKELIPIYESYDGDTHIPGLYLGSENVTSIATLDEYMKLEQMIYSDGVYKTTIKKREIEDNELSVLIDGNIYYIGDDPKDLYVKKGYNVVNSISLNKDSDLKNPETDKFIGIVPSEFIERVISQLEADLIIGRIDSNTILVSNSVEVHSLSKILVSGAIIDQLASLVNSKFALIAKFPCTKKLFSYSFAKNTDIEDYQVLNVNYKYNQMSGSWTFSFDEDSMDGYGNALYYDKFNDGDYANSLFHILEINQELDSPSNTDVINIDSWGNELVTGTPTLADYQTAILKYLEYEDKQYRFVWDSGYSNPNFVKSMFTVASSKNAQVVPSYPVDYKVGDEQKVVDYYSAIGIDSPRLYHVVPAYKSSNGSFLATIPGSVAYITARINSYKNITPEFQPLFGSKRGSVSAPNLVWRIKSDTRQLFADNNINCIVKDLNGTYLNFNMTGQKKTTYLSEEQNMYVSNVIAGICEEYNPTIIAEANTAKLWADVEKNVTSRLQQRIKDNKNPTVNGFRVRCTDVMKANPDYVESRRLVYYVDVMYNLSVAYVTAYVSVVRLNSF